MKSNYFIFTFFLILSVILGFLFCSLRLSNTPCASNLQAIGAIGTLLISLSALFYAIKEYDHHKESEKTSLLCQYLERYANSKHINVVINYILESALLDEKKNIVGYDYEKNTQDKPSIREFEMFMHFFEEVQLHIDNKMIDEKVAGELLGYYAGIFHKYKEFHKDVSDYDDAKYWRLYLKFVNNYLSWAEKEDNHE